MKNMDNSSAKGELYFFLFREYVKIWYLFGMENNGCITCGKSKAPLNCGICASTICKNCTQFMEEGLFSLLPVVPVDLTHQAYCFYCYDGKVGPALADYNADVEKAKEILVYTKDQTKETRLVKRLEPQVSVQKMDDRQQVTLGLAFLAMRAGYNAIIDVEIKYEKVRTGSYQTTVWGGTGIPAHVIESKMPKDKSYSNNPN